MQDTITTVLNITLFATALWAAIIVYKQSLLWAAVVFIFSPIAIFIYHLKGEFDIRKQVIIYYSCFFLSVFMGGTPIDISSFGGGP